MKSGAKWAIGLGSGCLGVLIGMVVLAVLAGNFVKTQAQKAEQRRQVEAEEIRTAMRARGFTKEVRGQSISIEEDIAEPTIYEATSFKLWSTCTTDLCVVAQFCEIYGTVEGSLVFEGQILTIHPSGVIKGDLEVDASIVKQHGKVLGSVSGDYQIFDN